MDGRASRGGRTLPQGAGASGEPIYDMSIGYDLAGIQTPKVVGFIRGMIDARDSVQRPPPTLEQRMADLLFEFAQRSRQRRLDSVENVRRPRDRSVARNLQETSEMPHSDPVAHRCRLIPRSLRPAARQLRRAGH